MPEFYNHWQRTVLRRVSNLIECDTDQEAIEKAQQAVNGFVTRSTAHRPIKTRWIDRNCVNGVALAEYRRMG
jgi:hypothetical protein